MELEATFERSIFKSTPTEGIKIVFHDALSIKLDGKGRQKQGSTNVCANAGLTSLCEGWKEDLVNGVASSWTSHTEAPRLQV